MNKPRIQVDEPGELVALVPYLIGFQPANSLLVLVFDQRALTVIVRSDLADLSRLDEHRLSELVDNCVDPEVMLIGWGRDLQQIHDALGAAESFLGVARVVDSLICDGERWWSRSEPSGPGQPVPRATTGVATAVAAGCAPLSSRDELAASVGGPGRQLERRLAPLYRERHADWSQLSVDQRGSAMRELVTAGCREAPVHQSDLIDLAVLADEVVVRDVAWTLLTRQQARDHVALWTQVVALAPDAWATPALCLLGMAAWVSGNGALQGCCVARARGLEPDYSMLQLLEDLTTRAVPPRVWDQMDFGAATRVD